MLSFGVGTLTQTAALTSGRDAAGPDLSPPSLASGDGVTGFWLNAGPDHPAGAAWLPLGAVVSAMRTSGTGPSPALVHAETAGGRLSTGPIPLRTDAVCRAVAVVRRSQGRGSAFRLTLTHASGEVGFDAAWRGPDVATENVRASTGSLRLVDWRVSRHEGDFLRLSATVGLAGAGPVSLGLGPVLPGPSAAVEIWGGGVAYELPAYDIADGGAGDALLRLDPGWPGWEAALGAEASVDAGTPLRFETGGVHVLPPLTAGVTHSIRIRAVYADGETDWSTS
jgi:hypothetical protein